MHLYLVLLLSLSLTVSLVARHSLCGLSLCLFVWVLPAAEMFPPLADLPTTDSGVRSGLPVFEVATLPLETGGEVTDVTDGMGDATVGAEGSDGPVGAVEGEGEEEEED